MLRRLRSLLTTLMRRERLEEALDEEVRFHVDACTEHLIRSSVPRSHAGGLLRPLLFAWLRGRRGPWPCSPRCCSRCARQRACRQRGARRE